MPNNDPQQCEQNLWPQGNETGFSSSLSQNQQGGDCESLVGLPFFFLIPPATLSATLSARDDAFAADGRSGAVDGLPSAAASMNAATVAAAPS